MLDELLSQRQELLETTKERGASMDRARSLWVDRAAQYLARSWGDQGFTDLWRKLLWTATKTEMYSNTTAGWALIQRMIDLLDEASCIPALTKPAAYAYAKIKEEMARLERDYGSEKAGTILA